MLDLMVTLQLDNSDEQAAQVRRELDSRLSAADEMTKVRLVLVISSYTEWVKKVAP